MRSERALRHSFGASLLLALSACSGGNDAPRPPEEKISRTDSVKVAPKAQTNASAAPVPGASFCEKLYAPGEKPFKAPVERKLSGVKAPEPAVNGWTYLNLWATWCKPCVEEMGNLGRWKEALAKDGNPINLELWSIDAVSDEDTLRDRVKAGGLPGNVHWVESEAAFASFIEGVGLDKTAAIPIHILIDPAQNVRCVRVGAIHPEDFAQVKGVVSQR